MAENQTMSVEMTIEVQYNHNAISVHNMKVIAPSNEITKRLLPKVSRAMRLAMEKAIEVYTEEMAMLQDSEKTP